MGSWEWWLGYASNLPPTVNGDRMRWKLTKNEAFNIRSFYNMLRSPWPIIFPWKGVWKVKAPRRVSFFVWTAVWDRILTGDNLRGRMMVFVTGVSCAVIMGRRWIICYFIVIRLIDCGVWCLDLLGLAKIDCGYSFWLVELAWKANV